MIGIARSAGSALIRRVDLVAVEPGQLDVHEDEVRALARRRRVTPSSPVVGLEHLVAGVVEQVAQDLAVLLVVLDDQDALGHGHALAAWLLDA